MFDWKEFCMILPVIMFLAWCIYYLSCNDGIYYFYISNVIANINYLIKKINDLIENIWCEFKRNIIEWLGVVFQLAIAALSVFVLGDANIWNVWWIGSIAIFATLCYCLKVCVEMKRAQLTRTCHYVNRRNNKKVWFFTITHGLEFLRPLLYLLLAYAYFMELYFQNHRMENDWKNVAFAIKLFIVLLSSVLAILSACKIFYVTPNDQNQIIPIPTIFNFPRNWNERILAYEMLRNWDVENPTVPDSNVVDNQAVADADADADALQRDVENQAVVDALQRDVENQVVANALQRDVENQAVADALHRDVENQPCSTEGCGEENQAVADALQRDVDNQAVADALHVENQSVADALHRDVENQPCSTEGCVEENQAVADALQRDVDNQAVADRPEMVQRDDAENQSYADANVH